MLGVPRSLKFFGTLTHITMPMPKLKMGRPTSVATVILFLALDVAAFAPSCQIPARTTSAQLNPHSHARLHATSSHHGPSSEEPANPTLELIQAWLLTRLPSLENEDLDMYSKCLQHDGYSTVEELDGLNSGASGRVEDLYFMRKGHRKALMTQIGGLEDASGTKRKGARSSRTDGMPTGISSTEVDGEFALVEEWVNESVAGESQMEVEVDDISRLEQNKAPRGQEVGESVAREGYTEVGVERAPRTRNEPTRSLSEDERCARPVMWSRDAHRALASREATPDHRSPGDRSRRPERRGRASRPAAAAASLSQDERCSRPLMQSRHMSASSRRATSDHRGPGDAHSLTRRSSRQGDRRADAVSLSGDERCARPAASSGGSASSRHRVVIGAPRYGMGPAHKKPAARSLDPTSLSEGETRQRPAPSSMAPSEYVTVNDRTGDARRAAHGKMSPADALASEVPIREIDSRHNATRTSLADISKIKVLSRATESTHRNVTKSNSNKTLAIAGREISLLKSLVLRLDLR